MSDFKPAVTFISAEIDDENYVKELTSKLLNDPEVSAKIKELGLKEEDIDPDLGKLLSYYEDRLPCRSCPGIENCPKRYPRTIMDLGINMNGRVERTMSSCPPAAKEEEISSRFLYRDYPEAFRNATLHDLGKNRKNSMSFLKATRETSPIIYVYGPEGSGVSFALSAYANKMAEDGRYVAYIDSVKRFGELTEYFFRNKEAFKEALDSLISVDVLFIDNLGTEYATEPIRDAILLPLFSGRKEKGRQTYIGSPFSIDSLGRNYMFKNRERGEYFASVLKANSKTVQFAPGLQGN